MDNYLFDTRGMSFCLKDSFGTLCRDLQVSVFPSGGGKGKRKKGKEKEKEKRKKKRKKELLVDEGSRASQTQLGLSIKRQPGLLVLSIDASQALAASF